MKKSLLFAALAALTFTACNSHNPEEGDVQNSGGGHPPTQASHVHEDGSVHKGHEADTTLQQSVKKDSVTSSHDHSDPNHKH